MVTVAVPLPPAFVAVTVKVVEDVTAVGVPLMVPSDVSKDKPAGRVGEIDQEDTVPPLAVGVTDVIATSLVKVNEFGE